MIRRRWRTAAAAVLFAVAVFQFLFALGLTIAASSLVEVLLTDQVFFLVAFGSVAPVGLLLAVHRPGNPIGWLLLVASIAQMNIVVTDRYATYIAGQEASTPPELTVLFWFTNWTWNVAFFLPFTFGFLLFPTGRVPSRRWRIFAWIGGSQLALVALASILNPGPLETPPEWPDDIANPTGVEALKAPIELALPVALFFVLLFVLGSAASLFIRLRSATPQERQQLKWLAYAASITVISFFISTLESVTTSTNVGWFILLLGLVAQPIAIGIAILRHNLYDIDRLINRTLVYGSSTALLGLGFAASILLFQLILAPFTSGNDLAVAGSTLLVFVLFRPLRDRLQRFVDRRFYRQRYDARHAVEAFRVSARDAIDAHQITREMASIVASTIQPSHVSIWLRQPQQRAGK